MNISFHATVPQFIDRSKDVTRRLGYQNVKRGQILRGVEKLQGLKRGEKVKHLGKIRVYHAWRERLSLMIANPRYGKRECIREGFPKLSPRKFVAMFCRLNNCEPDEMITRIEFTYL